MQPKYTIALARTALKQERLGTALDLYYDAVTIDVTNIFGLHLAADNSHYVDVWNGGTFTPSNQAQPRL